MSLRAATNVLRTSQRSAPSVARRAFATEPHDPKEPINQERGNSRTPFYIIGALITLGVGYKVATQGTPPTPAVKAMQQATHPKTPAARQAAGASEDPHNAPTKAGGDAKAKANVPPK